LGIRDAARGAERAVVVGGSFIGSEVAASLVQLGIGVTLLHRGRGLFEALRASELSDFLASLYRDRGVELLFGDELASVGDGTVQTRGGRTLAAELVVSGIGVQPVFEHVEGSGIALENGIVVDGRYATNAPDAYAAGDVASFHDPVFQRRRRIEHWSNASY